MRNLGGTESDRRVLRVLDRRIRASIKVDPKAAGGFALAVHDECEPLVVVADPAGHPFCVLAR